MRAASKAKTAQEEERAKMLELLTEDVAHVEEMEEADMLQRLEDLIVKGDEARSALTVLQHMPRSTKGTQMHMEYEESLVKARLRGERAAAAMDAFQGFAAQVARSEKARAEASTRALWAEKERGRLQQRVVQVQGALDQVKAELAQCRASTPHLCEWLHEHRQRGVGPGGCMRLSKLLQDEVRQRLDKCIAEWKQGTETLKAQLRNAREQEKEEEGKALALSESAEQLLKVRRDAEALATAAPAPVDTENIASEAGLSSSSPMRPLSWASSWATMNQFLQLYIHNSPSRVHTKMTSCLF